MVSNVGPSYNVLSLFQKTTDTAPAADTSAVDAIIAKVHQLSASASSARVQGASVATEAWLGAQDAQSSEELTSSAQVSAPQVNAPSTGTGRQLVVSPGPDGILSAVGVYNNTVKSQVVSGPFLAKMKDQLASEGDPSKIDYLNKSITLYEGVIKRNEDFLSHFSADMTNALAETREGYNIIGNIFENNEDGTLRFGVFKIVTKDIGLTYWQHDGSGTAIRSNTIGEPEYAFDLTNWHETALKSK